MTAPLAAAREAFEANPRVAAPGVRDIISSIYSEAYQSGAAALSAARGTAAALSNAQDAAAAYADDRAGSLISDIDATTESRVQGIIASAVQAGQSDREVADRLAPIFGEDRSNLIANTEMATAWNTGVGTALKDAGEDYIWVTDGDGCEACSQIDPDGEAWDIDEFLANVLEHPGCFREGRPLTAEELAEVMADDSEVAGEPEGGGDFGARVGRRRHQRFYSDDQRRDEKGRWMSGGSAGEAKGATDAAVIKVPKGEEGRCFRNAAMFGFDHEDAGAVVVHGKATMLTGKRIDHAWVELGDRVLDPTTGANLPKTRYYELLDAKPEARYTPSQAIANMVRIGNQGPWTAAEVGEHHAKFYSEAQARDERGRWTSGDGEGLGKPGDYGHAAHHDTVESANAWGRATQEAWVRTISPAEETALNYYTTYVGINDALRGNRPLDETAPTTSGMSEAKAVPLLDALFARPETALPEDVVVHRSWAGFTDKPIGKEFTDKGFCSTALAHSETEEFTRGASRRPADVEIRIPAGTHAIYLGSAPAGKDWYAGSTELLLARGTQFRVVGQHPGGWDDKAKPWLPESKRTPAYYHDRLRGAFVQGRVVLEVVGQRGGKRFAAEEYVDWGEGQFYSEDQPRDERGRIGKAAEEARTPDEHRAASDYHLQRAAGLAAKGGFPLAGGDSLSKGHERAAAAHAKAAVAPHDQEKRAQAHMESRWVHRQEQALLAGAEKFYSEDQPRVPSGEHGGGEFTKGDGGGWKQEVDKGGRPIPIRVEHVRDALPLLAAGKVVELKSEAKVATLLEKLAKIAAEAKAAGKEAPNYDLCKVTVAGASFFCGEKVVTKEFPNGIPRIAMPQLAGVPMPGTPASREPLNEKGKVDGGARFIEYMRSKGYGVEDEKVPASSLKASQAELVGTKIAAMMLKGEKDPEQLKVPIFISRDNYIIDGHHKWATAVGLSLKHDKDLKMRVHRVDAPIAEVLHLANRWADKFGFAQKAGTSGKHTKRFGADDEELFYSEDQARDDHGRWTKEGDEKPSENVPGRAFVRMKDLPPEQQKIRREQNAARAKAFAEREKAKLEAARLNPQPKPPEPPPPPPEPARPEPAPKPPEAGPVKMDYTRNVAWVTLLRGEDRSGASEVGKNGRTVTYDKEGHNIYLARADAGATTSTWDNKELVGRIAFDARGLPIPLPRGTDPEYPKTGESPLYEHTREYTERMRVRAEYALAAREQRARYEAEREARRAERVAKGPTSPAIKISNGPNASKERDAATYMGLLLASGLPPEHLDGLNRIRIDTPGINHFTGNDEGGHYSSRLGEVVISEKMKTGVAWGMAHEIGHHVHLARLSAKAADEWANISMSGGTCRISSYGKHNTGEHFAEAYKAYFGGREYVLEHPASGIHGFDIGSSFTRENLARSEPKAFAFMQRLATEPTMQMPVGKRFSWFNRDARYLQKAGTKSPRATRGVRWRRSTKWA